ncbi:hypothetical protein KI387_008552, partial [Taxus chinensis]
RHSIRQFMHSHVAQMKYIFPEGLLLEKIMLHDERTLCMKGADVPEKVLPKPFNKKYQPTPVKPNNVVSRPSFNSASSPRPPAPVKPNNVVSRPSFTSASSPRPVHQQDVQSSIMSSLLPKGFQRRFSQRILTPQGSLNSSCIPEQNQNLKPSDDPEVRKSDSSKSAVSLSANSHFPVGFKSRFAAKFCKNEISQISNDLKKPSEVDCSLILMSSDAISNNAPDQYETPCKVTKANPVTKNAVEENTPCKSILAFESKSPPMFKGCFTPTTHVAADSCPQKAGSIVSSAHNTPAVKNLLKSSVKNSISRRSLRFENSPNSPNASPPVSSPKTISFASPDSSCVSKSSGQKSKTSKVRRAVVFNKSNKNSSCSTICEDSSVCSTTLKRKAAEFQSTDTCMLSTPAKFEGMENYADSAMQSPLKMAKTSSPIFKNDDNTEHCKVDADRESNASKQTENGSISIQGSCSESLDVINQSEWEILQTLSPKFAREVGQSAAKRRQQMLACLPKLFNMIRDIFRSIKRSVITRQELIHKIISNHCDVTDRSEVEEQLQLLQELVPDWISGRTSTTGDFLY